MVIYIGAVGTYFVIAYCSMGNTKSSNLRGAAVSHDVAALEALLLENRGIVNDLSVSI